MQDSIRCLHFKLISKLLPKAVWKQSSHTGPSAVPEQSVWDTVPQLLQGHPVLSSALKAPAGTVVWQCSGCYLCLQNCLIFVLLLFLPATERSRSFSCQCCSVSKSMHCSLLSHPKHCSHNSGKETGTIQVHVIRNNPQKGRSWSKWFGSRPLARKLF